MSLKTQSKVLRTLDEQRFTPVGGDEPITVDARVIAATNKDLEEEISRGNFREDLFYRLNVIPFYVPPLRERKEDIALLVRHFLKEISLTYSRRPKEITEEAIDVLLRYSWPGNVRELRNAIERAVILADGGFIRSEHLPVAASRVNGGSPDAPASAPFPAGGVNLEAIERSLVVKALSQARHNKTRAAKLLGLTRAQLYSRIEKYGLAESES